MSLARFGDLELLHCLLLCLRCLFLSLFKSPLLSEHLPLLILQEVVELGPSRGSTRVATTFLAVCLGLERELLKLSFLLKPFLPLGLFSPFLGSLLVFHLPRGKILLGACGHTLAQLTSSLARLQARGIVRGKLRPLVVTRKPVRAQGALRYRGAESLLVRIVLGVHLELARSGAGRLAEGVRGRQAQG